VTDETPNPNPPAPPAPSPSSQRPPSSADTRARRPEYRGEELDPERGPGLGCFWFQMIVLGFFILLIPLGLKLNWPFEVLAILLFVVIGLLLLTGQTVIFLLRLVAADRRTQGRRRPLGSPTKTVGELEDEHGVEPAAADMPTAAADVPTALPTALPDDAEPPATAEPPADAEPSATAEADPAVPPEEPDPGVRQ